jgi:hypothetical protein
MSHDLVASFYGGYDQVGLVRARRWRIPRLTLLMAVAAILLIVFVAADVAAYENLPGNVDVNVTSVSWVSEGSVLTTSGGFALHGSERTTLSLSCSTVCIRFDGATASAPFSVVTFHLSYDPDQYTNVTVQAPTSAYNGPLTITLGVTAPSASGAVD